MVCGVAVNIGKRAYVCARKEAHGGSKPAQPAV